MKKKSSKKFNLLQWLESIFSPNSPEKKKRRLMRQIEQRITNSKYKFYKHRTRVADARLGKLFSDIYNVTSQTYKLLLNARNSDSLKEICVESSLTDEQRILLLSFDEKSIRENAQSMDAQVYADEIENNLKTYTHSFNTSSVQTIESNYALLIHFLNFISYDFSYIIKKFRGQGDSGNFNSIKGERIKEDLKDIIELILLISLSEGKWEFVFNVLSAYKDVQIINRRTWNRLSHTIIEITQSNILVMIVQHLSDDPLWKPTISPHKNYIMSSYLNNFKTRVNKILIELRNMQMTDAVKKLCNDVFDKVPISQLKNYSELTNSMFDPRIHCAFNHIEAMNYLYTYFLEFYQKKVQKYAELILVRGKWVSNPTSKKLSEPFYSLTDIFEKIINFDNTVSPEGEYGRRLKHILAQTIPGDRNTHGVICSLIQSINKRAIDILREAVNRIVYFGNILKLVISDIDKAPPKNFIINWEELMNQSNDKLKNQLIQEYKRMYFLIQLFKKILEE